MSERIEAMVRALGPVAGLLLAWVLFAVLAGGDFTRLDNQRLMLLQTAVVGTAAIGATFIIISGQIDLSVGSSIALATVVVALLLNAGAPPLLAALGGVGTGIACGLLVGALVIGRFGLPSFIVTLGMWGALRGVAKGLAGNQPVYPVQIGWIGELMTPSSGLLGLPMGVWMLIVLALLAGLALRWTRFGRHVIAVGSSEATARLCGVRVSRTKLLVFALGIGCAGLAGLLQCSYLSMGDPTTAEGYELQVIAAVVIGGASLNGGEGSIRGTLVGALIMTVVANGCTKLGIENWVQEIVTGAIIIGAVAVDRLRQRARA